MEPPMTLDEALRKLDLSQINSIQMVVLEAAVAALVRNHPNPVALRRDYDLLYAQMQASDPALIGEGAEGPVVASHLRDRLFEVKAR
jgi:hypothetical protein